MTWGMVASMVTAAIIIGMILIGGGLRLYFRKKFDVSEHFAEIDRAVRRQQIAKGKMHSAQTK